MRILLAGAGGQLGQDLEQVLAAEDLHAVRHQQLDIADRAAVSAIIHATRPDWVVNAAAFNDVDGAETARAQAFAVNADGPATLAEAARAVGARLVHVSTDYVFDGAKGSAYTEDDPANPLSVYGESKRAGEVRVLESGVKAAVLRTAWLYGRHGKNFVKAILTGAQSGKPLRVVADQVGSPTSTADLAIAIRDLIRTELQGLFHVANAGACSRFEFARTIVGGQVDVTPTSSTEAPRPARRPANSSLTSVRWEEAGMSPMRSWQEALADYLQSGG
ncbi:MAG: dTDP-4-dehydrorhamnose reductase [Candidatus Dormibacteraeota bacterium]|nr:dTDP-4-dehydrorhamnose reductase [Candidatus Dormibacteraeota bacterium]